jgi:hypothetical protein
LCREYPLRERLWELLMLALYRAGRQADAVRSYTEARGRLVDGLEFNPGPALRELEELSEAVRSGRPVTLIGPDGVSKTLLAVEAAATLRQEHPDGAWLARWPCRPQSSCSSLALGRCDPDLRQTGAPVLWLATSAAGWTAFPWPSNWPPRDSVR